MTDIKHTEASISRVLVNGLGMFPPRRFLCVENVSWGLLPWEADLLCMSANGYLQEVEIKTSVADLRRDRQKPKHRLRQQVTTYNRRRSPHTWLKRFWYAMPVAVWDRVAAQPPIPDDAGVILIFEQPQGRYGAGQTGSRVHREATVNAAATPLTDAEAYALARLGVLRYWDKVRA